MIKEKRRSCEGSKTAVGEEMDAPNFLRFSGASSLCANSSAQRVNLKYKLSKGDMEILSHQS